MPTRKSSLLRAILIIIISVGLLGFRNSAEPPPSENQSTNFVGWVEITIQAGAASGAGNSFSYYEWFPAKATMMISRDPNSSLYIVHGGSAHTLLLSYAIFAGGEGSIQMTVPVSWYINGILYPDCSLDLIIIVFNLPGKSIGCAPIVGCIEDTVPPDSFNGPMIRMAPNESFVRADFQSINSTSGTFIITKDFMAAGDDCIYLAPGLP